MSFRGLIATVGGTADPILVTIEQNQPEFVLFIVSADSRGTGELVAEAIELDAPPQCDFLEVSDPQHFGTSYEEIRRGTEDWLAEHMLDALEVTADITGGTKVLSAALALSGVERFREFTYVGGSDRDKGGLGVVRNGTEYVVTSLNPWDTYAVRDLERANRLLEKFHADIAAVVLKEAAGKCKDSYKNRLDAFSALAKALASSDRFDFLEAVSLYKSCREELAAAFNEDVFSQLEQRCQRWQNLRDETKNDRETPGRETLLELLANAERRKAQGRHDDAVGRLYRAVELHGQQLVKQAFGGELGRFKRDSIPEAKRDQFEREFGKPDLNKEYELPLRRLYRSLKYSDSPSLCEKAAVHDRLSSFLGLRNKSLLAHGVRPFPNKEFTKFRNATLEAFDLTMADIPRWPPLQLELLRSVTSSG